jgi:hypothetical protein
LCSSPTYSSTLIRPRSSWNLVHPSGLVSMLASWLSVLTNMMSIFPSMTHYLMKWYLVSLCLLRSWWSDCSHFNSERSCASHIPWQAAIMPTVYSAPYDDNVMTFYFCDPRKNRTPVVLLCISTSPSMSSSLKPTSFSPPLVL